ncbi:trypsin-like serine peptidase [Pyxidicoccus sp. 3LFB2]
MSVDSSHTSRRSVRTPVAISLIAGLFGFSASAQGIDERDIVQSPIVFPWNTVVKVKLGPLGGGRGSGGLIAGCTILTNGHVVWNGQTGTWREVASVHPGSYYSEVQGSSVDPYGSKVDSGRATNTKWIATLDSKYDYGAIFVASSFASMGINTYIPVAFEEEPGFINLSGYPSDALPLAGVGVNQEQWRGFGDVGVYESRRMYYEATSTGGASGSPVWVYYSSTNERYIVGVNRGHNSTWDGIGVRMVSQNQGVVEGWMNRPCFVGPGVPGAGQPLPQLSLSALLQYRKTVKGAPIPLYAPGYFRVVSPPSNRNDLVPKREVMQIIEGTYYRWQEFHAPGAAVHGAVEGDPDGQLAPTRFIHLLAPENRWLTAEEASVVLSASLLWMKAAQPTNPVLDPTASSPAQGVQPPAPLPVNDDPTQPEVGVQSTH